MPSSLRSLRSAWRIGTLGAALFCSALVARATSVEPPTFDELVNQSDYIVQAVVTSVTPYQRTMPNGHQTIYSRVELQVKESIAGKPPASVVLEVLGGKLGDRELAIEGAPKFRVGEEGVFFVQGNGTQIFPLVRMMHGLYRVEKDPVSQREYLTRSNGAALQDVGDVSGSLDHAGTVQATPQSIATALTPAAFIQKIRAAAHQPKLLEN